MTSYTRLGKKSQLLGTARLAYALRCARSFAFLLAHKSLHGYFLCFFFCSGPQCIGTDGNDNETKTAPIIQPSNRSNSVNPAYVDSDCDEVLVSGKTAMSMHELESSTTPDATGAPNLFIYTDPLTGKFHRLRHLFRCDYAE